MFRKYIAAFTLSFTELLTYRTNFIIGRVRNIVVLLLLYFVWLRLSQVSGHFAGFTQTKLMTYVFGVYILRAFVFGSQSRKIASEINDGSFSVYLTRPVSHVIFYYMRELAERLLYTLTAVIEVWIIVSSFNVELHVQTNLWVVACACGMAVCAHISYFILSYCVSMIAFWSREAMGPRFLFEWFLEFAAGSYFPLNILHGILFSLMSILPFAYLLYVPLMVYMGGEVNVIQIFLIVLLWIIVCASLAKMLWNRGLRRYTGEGI